MDPYRRLSRRPQLAKDSILVAQPTNPFAGFGQAVLRLELVTALVAFSSVLSKFTPILLSNIPFSPVQTWTLHVVCTWMAVAILGFMILVLLLQSLVKDPYLPMNPEVVAGAFYYLADSAMLANFKDASTLSQKDLAKQIDPKMQFSFGKMVGVSGKSRIGVNYAKQADI